MMTRWIIATSSSPGSGYFQAWSVGWPTCVLTRYISPTWRWSCWNVAIFFESGDHDDDRAIALRPAGVVGGVAEVLHAISRELRLLPVATSRTHKFQSLDEHRSLAVGRRDVVAGRTAAATGGTAPAGSSPPCRARWEIAGRLRRLCGIDQECLAPVLGRDPIPEAPVGQPRRPNARAERPTASCCRS